MKASIVLLVTLLAGSVFAGELQQAKCGFRNIAGGYVGVCGVTESFDPDQTTGAQVCADILNYLLNPMHGGKNYCQFATASIGWQQEEILSYLGRFDVDTLPGEAPVGGELGVYQSGVDTIRVDEQLNRSAEQFSVITKSEGSKQLVVAYKLDSALEVSTVFVLNAPLGSSEFSGEFYRVALPLDQIRTLVQQGLTLIPKDWVKVGSGNLTER